MATTMMTDEEKEELEKAMNADRTPPPASLTATPAETPSSETPTLSSPPKTPTTKTSSRPLSVHSNSLVSQGEDGASTPTKSTVDKEKEALRKKEQRDKLREHEKERRKVMEARVSELTIKTIERLRPFVEAKHPGDKDDPETLVFEKKIKREAEDLKLESFGVEVGYPAFR